MIPSHMMRMLKVKTYKLLYSIIYSIHICIFIYCQVVHSSIKTFFSFSYPLLRVFLRYFLNCSKNSDVLANAIKMIHMKTLCDITQVILPTNFSLSFNNTVCHKNSMGYKLHVWKVLFHYFFKVSFTFFYQFSPFPMFFYFSNLYQI